MKPAAIAKLNAALIEVTSSPEVSQALLKTGWQAQPGTPDALAKRMRSDTARLGGVIIMKGIQSETWDAPRSAFGPSPTGGRTQRPGKAGSAGALEWALFYSSSETFFAASI